MIDENFNINNFSIEEQKRHFEWWTKVFYNVALPKYEEDDDPTILEQIVFATANGDNMNIELIKYIWAWCAEMSDDGYDFETFKALDEPEMGMASYKEMWERRVDI